MHKYMTLTKRNCLVFLRDRGAVFFALLSMFIVLMLQGLFLGDMNVEAVTELLLQYGGERDIVLDRENAARLIQYWTLAGILVVNAVTVTLTVIGTMITDASENRLESFYSAPVGKNIVALSYVTSAVVIGTLFCFLTFIAALGYIGVTGGELLSFGSVVRVLGYILLIVFIFALIMYLAALFIKSSSAWSGIATVVGTLVGFVGAIYLPMGALPEKVAGVLKYLPVLHGASLMRKECCTQALAAVFEGMPEEMAAGYMEEMGITIAMWNTNVKDGAQLLFLCVCGAVALLAIAVIAGRKSISDR